MSSDFDQSLIEEATEAAKRGELRQGRVVHAAVRRKLQDAYDALVWLGNATADKDGNWPLDVDRAQQYLGLVLASMPNPAAPDASDQPHSG